MVNDNEVKTEETQKTSQDYKAYGVESQNRGQALHIDFRTKEPGNRCAPPYSYLILVRWKESDNSKNLALELEYVHVKVTIEGRNLEPLYSMLLEHKITYIQEFHYPKDHEKMLEEEKTFIRSIKIDFPEKHSDAG